MYDETQKHTDEYLIVGVNIALQDPPAMLERLQQAVLGNVFAMLMDAVRCCSLGQIEVGGQYRRSM